VASLSSGWAARLATSTGRDLLTAVGALDANGASIEVRSFSGVLALRDACGENLVAGPDIERGEHSELDPIIINRQLGAAEFYYGGFAAYHGISSRLKVAASNAIVAASITAIIAE